MRMRATDLLPTVYDYIIAEFTHKRLLSSEKEGILRAIINTTRWSAEACAREKSTCSNSLAPYTNSLEGSTDEFITADHFCSKWASRNQIVTLIQGASGLDYRMAHLSLLFIETRVDIALASRDSIVIEEIGTIQYESYKTENYIKTDEKPIRSRLSSWYEQLFSEILKESSCSKGSILLRLFNMPSRHLTVLVERLELAAVFRTPISYRIELFSETKTIESLETGKKLLWKKASDRSKLPL